MEKSPASQTMWAPVTPLPGHSKYRVGLLLKSVVSECAPTTMCTCVGCICMCAMCLGEYMCSLYMHAGAQACAHMSRCIHV